LGRWASPVPRGYTEPDALKLQCIGLQIRREVEAATEIARTALAEYRPLLEPPPQTNAQ